MNFVHFSCFSALVDLCRLDGIVASLSYSNIEIHDDIPNIHPKSTYLNKILELSYSQSNPPYKNKSKMWMGFERN
jgi:hypothetical protein